MQTRQLGYSDLQLTVVGLGTWAIGGGGWIYGWGPQDDADSIAAIQRALDLGINWIDTAAVYGAGHSEEVVSRAITGRRHEVIVATKGGRILEPGQEQPFARLKADSLRREVEASLRRLRVEAIDLYQIHWPDPDEDIEEGWGAVAELIREGKVRYGGVSNFSVAQLKRIQPIHPVVSLQPPYSMLRRGIEDELLDYCAANNIGVIAYSPMQAGLLTGKFSRERLATRPDDDWRPRNEHFQEPQLSLNLELVEKLRPMAARHGRNVAQLAIAWVLRRPEITAAIVGARHPAQIEETAPAGDWQLSAAELAEIDNLLAWREQRLQES
ncbi:MAG: aldo/keto reductase [Anaerolineae bacterium]|nr:aldo/keto reductase [Anaerolineales bacterium]MCQ3973737.1 aldo/keto reductase [Anaerolineae bacterium]